jgi:serine/threonine protein kinase
MSGFDERPSRPSRRRDLGIDVPAPLKPGALVAGRYRIEALLGEGGMGTVYRATQLALRRAVALKVLLPHMVIDPLARARFEREARVASRVRHRNAVEVYDFGQENDVPYLAMELLHGQSLRSILEAQDSPLPLPRALNIARQVALALVAAHREQLIHRDIKPENIFLEREPDGEERAVVVDFGLAFIADHDELGRVTRQGVLHGSPAYMSPEQARDPKVEAPSDVYSLGCVLHELVTGDVPFPGGGLQVLSRHCFTLPESPRARFPHLHLPAALDALILRMLRKHPAGRPTADDVRHALETLEDDQRTESERAAARAMGRAARMVPAPPTSKLPLEAPPPADLELRVEGPLSESLGHVLLANGMAMTETGRLVLALEQSVEHLFELAAQGPVVADADPKDMARIADLLRAGVLDVVPRPITAEELVRRLRRVAKRLDRG